MTKRLDFYRCEICGNIVQVLHEGNGELVCCNKPMVRLESHSKEEEIGEKHVPFFFNDEKIQVGSVLHPMLDEHHIDFIEALSHDKKCIKIKFLDINEEPSMLIDEKFTPEVAYEYCNIHGFWKGEK